ncbi:efflux RND transporter periplasmic adaptor subunit [Vibrio pectenicida]|uniref:efflux RND transporter periplasmic adaptor subunit n=1 Tax=Vibrio pectenicida TaxID=62763 RepID=UPI003B9BDA58
MSGLSLFHFLSARPYIISLTIIFVLSVWLGLGSLKAKEDLISTNQDENPKAKVVFQTFTAHPTQKSIDLYGRTAPDKQAKLGAEIAGKIVALAVSKGETVTKGQAIARIDKRDLDIQVERAEALLKLREKEHKAVQSLKNKGLQGEVAFSKAQADLIEARAGLRNAKIALRNTAVIAPFNGVVERLYIELGDFVGVGDPVATLIDLSQIVIEADVSERHIQDLVIQQPASVTFIDGQRTEGKIRYISRFSSATTNTFPIEILLPNPQQRIPAGVSAQVELNLRQQLAVKVTPAMLALDESGNLGVKTLDEDLVEFIPVQLVKAEQDGVWLTGLGQKVRIITIGQGFVRNGDKVIAIEAKK